MPIQIHGKEYKTVAERLEEASAEIQSIDTEVLNDEPVVIKATLVTKKGSFTGISSANQLKSIEKSNPYEVAETSAVGRALAFAGYAGSEIASADEMIKAGAYDPTDDFSGGTEQTTDLGTCPKCSAPMAKSKAGNNYCSAKCWLS